MPGQPSLAYTYDQPDEPGEPFWTEVIDAMAARVGVLDDTGHFIAANRAWKDRAAARGRPKDYPVGCHLHDLTATVPTRYGRMLNKGYKAVVEGRRSEFSCAYPVPTRGEDDWFKQTLTVMGGDGGHRMVVVIQSIQELKRAEARLRAANVELTEARDDAEAADTAKSVFLGMMTHEISTPLNGVLGMARVMAAGALPELQRRRLELIEQSGEALLTLLGGLLALSGLQAGKVTLHNGPVDLAALGAWAEEDGRALLADKPDVAFHLSLDVGAIASWIGDERRLRQMLHALLANAAKFTDHGFVTVELSHEAGQLVMRVRDTGVGIAADQQARIFDSFVQADDAPTRRHDGAGLGLAICRRLAALMGGAIAVDSSEGAGTTFTVTLPAAEETRAQAVA